MTSGPMTDRIILVAFALGLGCTARDLSGGDDDGAADDGATSESETSAAEAGSQSGAVDGGDGGADAGGTPPAPSPSTCAGGSDFVATADLIDTGSGPAGADVTIQNCTAADAWLFQDCCFGAAFDLQRRDEPAEPWRDAIPDVDCNCEGPGDPIVIGAGETYAFEASPSGLDSEPICAVGDLEYRFVLRATRAECEDCWQEVPTTAFAWYCEG